MSDLPRGWARARLDEVAEVRLGRQRSPKNHSGTRMRPYVRAANVTWQGLDLIDVKAMNFSENESCVYELRVGDVLVAEASGSPDEVGKPALWRGEIDGCCFQNTLIRVRSHGVLPEFLRYFLLAEARSGRIGRASPGVGIHHIGAARLSAWSVTVPPLAEQSRIVAVIEEQLSRLDAAEKLAHRVAAGVDVLHARWVDDVASRGQPVKLGDCLREPLTNGRSVPTAPEGLPVLRLSALKHGAIDLSERKIGQWSPGDAVQFLVRRDDFFIARGNGSLRLVGRGGLVEVQPDAVAFPDTLIRARVDERIVSPRYLRLIWNSRPVRAQIERTARTTAGIYKVNQQDLRNVSLHVPRSDEQAAIVAEAERQNERFAAIRTTVQDALRRSAVLRCAILSAGLGGELVPQDPNDEPASVLLERIAAERAAAPKPTRRRATVSA